MNILTKLDEYPKVSIISGIVATSIASRLVMHYVYQNASEDTQYKLNVNYGSGEYFKYLGLMEMLVGGLLRYSMDDSTSPLYKGLSYGMMLNGFSHYQIWKLEGSGHWVTKSK